MKEWRGQMINVCTTQQWESACESDCKAGREEEFSDRFAHASPGLLSIIKSGERGWKGTGSRRKTVSESWATERVRKRRAHISGTVTSRCRDGGEGKPRAWSRERCALFNLETLPVAKVARLWPAAWLVLWSGASRFIFSARSAPAWAAKLITA